IPMSENTVYPTEPENMTEKTRVWSQASAIAMRPLIALFVALMGSPPDDEGLVGWVGRTHAVDPGGSVGVADTSRFSSDRTLFMWLSRRILSVAPTRPLSVFMSASTASSTLLRSVLVTSTTGVPPIGGTKSVPNRRLKTFTGLYSGGLKLSGPLWER